MHDRQTYCSLKMVTAPFENEKRMPASKISAGGETVITSHKPVRRLSVLETGGRRAAYCREAEWPSPPVNALNDKHKEHPLDDMIGGRRMGWDGRR